MIEGVESVVEGDGVVVESLLIHFDWFNDRPDQVGKLKFKGPIVVAEDVDSLVVESICKSLEVVSHIQLFNRDLVCLQSGVELKAGPIMSEESDLAGMATGNQVVVGQHYFEDLIWPVDGLVEGELPMLVEVDSDLVVVASSSEPSPIVTDSNRWQLVISIFDGLELDILASIIPENLEFSICKAQEQILVVIGELYSCDIPRKHYFLVENKTGVDLLVHMSNLRIMLANQQSPKSR